MFVENHAVCEIMFRNTVESHRLKTIRPHAHCMLDTLGKRHKLRICIYNRVCTATIFARKSLNIILYVICLLVNFFFTNFSIQQCGIYSKYFPGYADWSTSFSLPFFGSYLWSVLTIIKLLPPRPKLPTCTQTFLHTTKFPYRTAFFLKRHNFSHNILLKSQYKSLLFFASTTGETTLKVTVLLLKNNRSIYLQKKQYTCMYY